MTDIAIRVRELGKQYSIGEEHHHPSLVDSLTARVPFLRHRASAPPPDGWVADNRFWALSDVSFEVGQGDVVGIIGANGSGKSTLLKILSRITPPTTGRAEVYGRVGALLEVGTGFHPELTGYENVFLSGAMLGMRRSEVQRRLDEILDFSGIEKFIDTPVKWYSSGMYMRLAFSVAAHLESEIMLVDEVLAVGDVGFQAKCLNRIRQIASDGRTVIMVSHNMDSIEKLCSWSMVLHQGKVACVDDNPTAIKCYSELCGIET